MKQCILWTRKAYQFTMFRLLGALMKVHPIPHAIFETTRSGFFKFCITVKSHVSVTTVQNFILLTAKVKFHQICTLIGYFCWKYDKISAKKSMAETCLMIPKNGAKFEEKIILCFKNDKNFVNFDPSTKNSRKFVLWFVPFVQSI